MKRALKAWRHSSVGSIADPTVWALGVAIIGLGCTAEIGEQSPGASMGNGVAGAGGSQAAAGAGAGGGLVVAPFAPANASFKRLTASEFNSSMTALLGPVTLGSVEPDTWVGGFAKVGSSTVSISLNGVEKYQQVIDAATSEVFADPTRRDAFVGCAAQGISDEVCIRSFVERFGRLAWRRALSPEQVERFTALAGSLSQTLGSASDALRVTANAILMSPNFLYRLERGEPDSSSMFWRYTGYELASRLAYFLTNGPPDEALLAAAEQGLLADPEGIRSQAERLLQGVLGRESVGNFASELFQLGIVLARAKDSEIFPSYTAGLQRAMVREVPAMLQDLVFEQAAPATDFFTTRTTFVNAELATLYGIDAAGMTSDSWVKVTWHGLRRRRGAAQTLRDLVLRERHTAPPLESVHHRQRLADLRSARSAGRREGLPDGRERARQQVPRHRLSPARLRRQHHGRRHCQQLGRVALDRPAGRR